MPGESLVSPAPFGRPQMFAPSAAQAAFATPVTAWADFIPRTRLHAVKDTATATSVTTATLLPCSFMANVYRLYVRRLRNERMRTSADLPG